MEEIDEIIGGFDMDNREKIIKELSLKITRAGASYAESHASLFLDNAKTNAGININQEMMVIALKYFSFLMWFYANGIWSNWSCPVRIDT